MRKTTSIELELFKGGDNGVKFYAKQFDDLKLKVKVFDGTEQVDISKQDITVFILKEDKTVIEQKKDILVDEENTIIIDLSKQSTTALGKCLMELSLSDKEGNASTSTMSYMVGEKLSASIVDIIKSEDDINALNLIEEFIEASNIDILEIKEAIQELRDYTVNAENTLEDKYNEIINALEDYKSELIENTKAEINEIVLGIDEAVEKAEEAVEIVNNSLDRIEGIDELVSGALEDINDTKMEVIGTIDTKKEQTISEMEEKGIEIIETISEEGQIIAEMVEEALENISNVDVKVEEGLTSIEDSKVRSISLIDETTEANIGDINNKGEEVKEGIANSSLLEVNKIHNAREEAIVKIGEKEAEVLSNIEGSKEGVIEELTTSISTLKEQAKADLDTVLEEVIREGTLDINAIEEEIQSMKIDVENVLTSITDKIQEANTTYEELAELVEEAKRVIGLTRAFIEEKAVDLSNYYTKEEVDELLSNIDLSSIYTKEETYNKEEVDNLINKALNDTKADVAYGNYVSSPNGFEEAFKVFIENPYEIKANIEGNVVSYVKGTIGRKYGSTYGARVPGVILITDYKTCKLEVENSATTNRQYDIIDIVDTKGTSLGTSDRSRCTYPFLYNEETGTFKEGLAPSSSSDRFLVGEYYYTSVDIYTNNLEGVLLPACEGEIKPTILDFNRATDNGRYNVKINIGEEIANSPDVEELDGILEVENTKTKILQRISDKEQGMFIRIFTGINWTEWSKVSGGADIDLSSYITIEQLEEAINGIDIPEVDLSGYATKEELNNIEIPSIEGLASTEYVNEAIRGIEIPNIDTNNLATKEELQEAISNIDIPEVDLSSYSTTEEVRNLINESVGVVRSSLIEDINDIIRGL